MDPTSLVGVSGPSQGSPTPRPGLSNRHGSLSSYEISPPRRTLSLSRNVVLSSPLIIHQHSVHQHCPVSRKTSLARPSNRFLYNRVHLYPSSSLLHNYSLDEINVTVQEYWMRRTRKRPKNLGVFRDPPKKGYFRR